MRGNTFIKNFVSNNITNTVNSDKIKKNKNRLSTFLKNNILNNAVNNNNETELDLNDYEVDK